MLACARLAVPPTKTVFVDDARANVDAAAALGIRALLHRNTGDTIAALEALIRAE
jgi:FMN phosphatase YigB (HAD superfamily)